MSVSSHLPGPRPQPLGVLPWPAGLLVLPDADGEPAAAAAALLRRGELPQSWPTEWEFVAVAAGGEAERAASLVAGDDAISDYNRAVLVGGDDVWARLAATAQGDLALLVATARFSVGLHDDAPAVPDAASGEVAAVGYSARASAALEVGDGLGAVAELQRAQAVALTADAPVLAATMALTRAELLRDQLGDPAGAVDAATDGLQLLAADGPDEVCAELRLTRALARQEVAGTDPSLLPDVVADLTEALKVLREESHPELFAVGNQHLGLAYLTLPMSEAGERLRMGIAVTCLRAALRVYTPQTHPVAWASAQLNLANALQYLPSADPTDTLDEAVQLYEELLSYRDPVVDPLGTARALANQGNALGHLGASVDAIERLSRAIELFDAAGDTVAADDTRQLLAQVEQAMATAGEA